MNLHYLKKAAVLGGLLIGSQAYSQDAGSSVIKPFAAPEDYRTWSVGVHGGALTPQLFASRYDFSGQKVDIGYGAYVKHQVLHGLGFRADFLRGKLEATRSLNGNYPKFSTELHWSGSINADMNVATINWLHGTSAIIPYVSAGYGLIAYSPTLYYPNGTSAPYKVGGNIHEQFIPLGAGLKFTLGPDINLNLAYQANLIAADNLDGYVDGTGNDKFSYTSVGLEFALGSKSRPQLATTNPVKVMYDDYVSRNDALKSELAAQKTATEAALAAQREAMQKQFADLQQQLNGATTDSDGDGVLDRLDKCPGTPSGTKVDGSGCPLPEAKNVTIITEEDRRIVRDAIDNLEFDFGKATIRERSYPSLERVARLLTDKNFSLKLSGHTDNVGSDAANLKLSKDRAESVKAFLVAKGANPSRIEATGYGESQPIATNNTAEGRQKNRRVEFALY
jgi:OOP family OmpA-OmpF porin